jgi:hypothetical protein
MKREVVENRNFKSFNNHKNLIMLLLAFVLVFIFVNSVIAAENSTFDDKKVDSWINDLNKFQALSSEMKQKAWDDPATTLSQKVGFINDYAKKLGLNINIRGIDSKGLVWGEGGVFGFNGGAFLDFTRLNSLKDLNSLEFKDNKIIYGFKDGSQFSHDQGYFRPEDRTLLSTKDKKYDNFIWNGKGKAEFVNNELKLEKGSQFSKVINNREVVFGQFYFNGNSRAPYNVEKDEVGILKINSGGYFEGKNINPTVDGINFYSSRDSFTKLMGNFFKESSAAETTAEWGVSLFRGLTGSNGPKDNGDFIKADMQNNKVFIEMGGKKFAFVDVTDSKDQIGQIYMKGELLYARSGDFLASEKNGKLSFNGVQGSAGQTSNGMLIINGNDVKNARMLGVSDEGGFYLFDPELRAVINGAENLVGTKRGRFVQNGMGIYVDGKEKDKQKYYSNFEDYKKALLDDPTLKVTFQPYQVLGRYIYPAQLGDQLVDGIAQGLSEEKAKAGGWEQFKAKVGVGSTVAKALGQEQKDGIALFNAYYDQNGNYNSNGDVAKLREFVASQPEGSAVIFDKANKDVIINGNSFKKTYKVSPDFVVGLTDNVALNPPSSYQTYLEALREGKQYKEPRAGLFGRRR